MYGVNTRRLNRYGNTDMGTCMVPIGLLWSANAIHSLKPTVRLATTIATTSTLARAVSSTSPAHISIRPHHFVWHTNEANGVSLPTPDSLKPP